MGTADQLVALEDSWVGTVENPPHSNHTFIGVEFGFDRVAWCAETQSLALKKTGTPGFWTASVAQAIADAKNGHNGLTWVPRNGVIRKGDMPTYDWGGRGNSGDFHIACVRDPGTQVKFQTVAGNENDSVMVQWRDRTYVQGFIRPAYDSTQVPEEDDMKLYVRAKGDDRTFEVNSLWLTWVPTTGVLEFDSQGHPKVVTVEKTDAIWFRPEAYIADDGTIKTKPVSGMTPK